MKKILLSLSVITLFAACGSGGDTATVADSAKISAIMTQNYMTSRLSVIDAIKTNSVSTADSTGNCTTSGTYRWEMTSSESDLYAQATACQSNPTSCTIEVKERITFDACKETNTYCSGVSGSTLTELTTNGPLDMTIQVSSLTSTTGISAKLILDGLLELTSPGLNSGNMIKCKFACTFTFSDLGYYTDLTKISYEGTICNRQYSEIKNTWEQTRTQLCTTIGTEVAAD